MELNLMALPGLPEDAALLVTPPSKSGIVLRRAKKGTDIEWGVYVAREDIASGKVVVIKNIS